MPRLRNAKSGVVVNVDDRTAAKLVGRWVPVDPPKPAPKRRAKSE